MCEQAIIGTVLQKAKDTALHLDCRITRQTRQDMETGKAALVASAAYRAP